MFVSAVCLEVLKRMKQREYGGWQLAEPLIVHLELLLLNVFKDVAEQCPLLLGVIDVWIATTELSTFLISEFDDDILVGMSLAQQRDQVVKRCCAHVLPQLLCFRMKNISNCAKQGNVCPRVGSCSC